MPELLIDSVELTNFRNHSSATFTFGQVTAITGANGSGKTAILEAVAYLSVADSWKAERDVDVVQWEKPFARITGATRDVVIQRHPAYKRYKLDGISKRLTDILGLLPTVLFQPDDSALVHGSPSYRRRSLDRLLSQTVPGYAKELQTLQKVVKQRNKLLKQIGEGHAQEQELVYWDEELARAGMLVQGNREKVVTEFSEGVAAQFAELLPEALPIRLGYQQSHCDCEHLAKNRHKELAAGTTLYGPHREDLSIHYGNHPAAEALSRGQTRAVVLAFRLAELGFIERRLETKPILLLDDIFAEFDQDRRARIFKLLGEYQTIMTMTDVSGLPDEIAQTITVIEV